MVNIAFWDNYLCERGTSVAIYDYAYYNEKLLNNKSIIIYNKSLGGNNNQVIDKFKDKFKVFGIDDFSFIEPILEENNIDILYVIKWGTNDNRISKKIKTVVHCVFDCSEPHGDIYSVISKNVRNYKSEIPIVPHMINLPDVKTNLRSLLNIPKNAIVFGRYGGFNEFNIRYVHEQIYLFAYMNKDKYFIFANTNNFCNSLPNIIHLPQIIDLELKVQFINTCDAMIWARGEGETFGLSIAEFSTKNKPIICCKSDQDNAHIEFLKDKCLLYDNDKNSLYKILDEFKREDKDYNAYKDFEPEKVMKIFKEVYIDN